MDRVCSGLKLLRKDFFHFWPSSPPLLSTGTLTHTAQDVGLQRTPYFPDFWTCPLGMAEQGP